MRPQKYIFRNKNKIGNSRSHSFVVWSFRKIETTLALPIIRPEFKSCKIQVILKLVWQHCLFLNLLTAVRMHLRLGIYDMLVNFNLSQITIVPIPPTLEYVPSASFTFLELVVVWKVSNKALLLVIWSPALESIIQVVYGSIDGRSIIILPVCAKLILGKDDNSYFSSNFVNIFISLLHFPVSESSFSSADIINPLLSILFLCFEFGSLPWSFQKFSLVCPSLLQLSFFRFFFPLNSVVLLLPP